MKALRSLRIAHKLPLIILGVAAVAIIATATAGYLRSEHTLTAQADARLKTLTSHQAARVESLLDGIGKDLVVQSTNVAVIDALTDFSEAYQTLENGSTGLMRAYIDNNPYPPGEKDKLQEGTGQPGYDALHFKYHGFFDQLQDANGYYDVFLIDLSGNIIYSVFKEADFATNLMTGKWRDTGLSEVFRAAKSLRPDAPSAFDDFAPYTPSADAPAAFLARPVFAPDGTRLGVLAYQMPVDAINAVTDTGNALGQTGYSFLVGRDGLLRTDTPITPHDDILTTKINQPSLAPALKGQSGQAQFDDMTGTNVVAQFAPIRAYDQTWSIIAAQSTNEMLAPLRKMRAEFFAIGGALLVLVLGLAGLVSRSITRPLGDVNTAMAHIAADELGTQVPAQNRADEIGEIAQTLERFRGSLLEFRSVAREALFKSSAFGQASCAMMMVDGDFNVVYANDALTDLMSFRADAFEELTGVRDAQALIGKNMDSFHKMPKQARDRLRDPANLPFRTIISVGGSYFDLAVNAVMDVDGETVGYLVEWTNQTKALRDGSIMAALDATAARLELGPDGTIQWANTFVCNALGVDVSALLGQPASTILHPDSGSFGAATLADLMGKGEHLAGVATLSRKGATMDLDIQMVPVRNPLGGASGVVILGHDVTKARAIIAEAEAAQRENAREQDTVVNALRAGLSSLAEGDFSGRIETQFAARYEQLRTDFNMATARLEQTIQTILQSAGSIGLGTKDISSAALALSQRTESQAATLEQTAAALDQLTASVKTASDGAKDAAQMVNSARHSVENSGSVVEDTVSAMSEIERFSGEISKISGVIDDIAFQTNLLALNAGVEAARAGESGRGFAVVASEVRALAQRSSDAAREINELISSSSTQIERGVNLVSQTGAVLKEMMGSIVQISGRVDDIAYSATEQATGLREINVAINDLDQTTQKNAAMFEETSAATVSLAHEANQLTSTMETFRIRPSAEGQTMGAKGKAGRPGLAA